MRRSSAPSSAKLGLTVTSEAIGGSLPLAVQHAKAGDGRISLPSTTVPRSKPKRLSNAKSKAPKKTKRSDSESSSDSESDAEFELMLDSNANGTGKQRELVAVSDSAKMHVFLPSVKQSTMSLVERVRVMLTAPFRVPLRNYSGSVFNGNRALGMKQHFSMRAALHDPFAENALVLHMPPALTAEEELKVDKAKRPVAVVVDPLLSQFLRPHQREGVKFMYDCVTGEQIPEQFGCIMADEMGLGKTLQCITLLWTLLRQSPDACPTISKVAIVTPSSLVKNWSNELQKWLKNRIAPLVIDGGPHDETSRVLEQFVKQQDRRLLANNVLIISYESFRSHADALHRGQVGLLICDEGHRLKNCENQTYQALNKMNAKRRLLLSGTPIQNDLLEYYSLIDFVNGGLLGSASEFRRKFESPILRARDSESTDKEREEGETRLKELLSIVNRCVIRRTQDLLKQYLPVKYEQVIFVRLTEMQSQIYRTLSKQLLQRYKMHEDVENVSSALSAVTQLKKLCNHPDLLLLETADHSKKEDRDRHEKSRSIDSGQFLKYFPEGYNVTRRQFDSQMSGKMRLLDNLLQVIKTTTQDRVVLISNYTQTLDLFEQLAKSRRYEFCRLDGTLTVKKRGQLVDRINDPESGLFIFMLSSKAGGCGLNLVGANRLIMFDPDWNPANDDQAMARIWRDGQKKLCYIYRFITTGAIEEKILQRQEHKKALSAQVVDAEQDVERHFSFDELRELFTFNETTVCETHEKFKCKRCLNGVQVKPPPPGSDCGADLTHYSHVYAKAHLDDVVLKQAWDARQLISFIMYQTTQEERTLQTP